VKLVNSSNLWPVLAVSGVVSQQQVGGAKVLAQSESLTRYEIQNKDRLTEPRPLYRRPAPYRQQHQQHQQQQQKQQQQQQNGGKYTHSNALMTWV
jgi:hypothetical protein